MKREENRGAARGTAIVEAAIVLPLLLVLILGGLDFGFQLHVLHTMTSAARDAVRLVAVRGGTPEAATAAATNELAGIQATFSVTFPPPTEDPCDTIVRISVPRDQVSLGVYRLLGLDPGGTIQVQAVMRKEQ